MLVTETFVIYNLLLLCGFLWCRLPPAIRGHIPGRAISDVGAKAGSQGLKRSDCSPCTTCLFSAARHFQTVPHFSKLISLKGCVCVWHYVQRDTDVILGHACLRNSQHAMDCWTFSQTWRMLILYATPCCFKWGGKSWGTPNCLTQISYILVCAMRLLVWSFLSLTASPKVWRA